MRSTSISVTEAVRRFSEYIGRVTYRRESFLLRKGNRTVAELRPVPVGVRPGDLPRLLASLPRLSEEEARAFAEDLRSARAELGEEPMRDPWRS